jgi:hypothetical protein
MMRERSSSKAATLALTLVNCSMHISSHRPPALQSDLHAKLIPRFPTTFCGRVCERPARSPGDARLALLKGLLQMKCIHMPSCIYLSLSLSLSTHKFAHISQLRLPSVHNLRLCRRPMRSHQVGRGANSLQTM